MDQHYSGSFCYTLNSQRARSESELGANSSLQGRTWLGLRRLGEVQRKARRLQQVKELQGEVRCSAGRWKYEHSFHALVLPSLD